MAHKRARVLRVFLSHTSELRDHPHGGSYVDAAERAVSAAGHAVVNMVDFPAADQRPSQVCSELVRESDVLISLIGMRYGTPVVDRPAVSYTELEFDVATDAGVPRLVFMLDDENPDVRMPPRALTDREHGAAQDAYRDRLRNSDVTIRAFSTPDNLETVVERSLRNLATALEELTDEDVGDDRRQSRTSLPATNLPRYVDLCHGRDDDVASCVERVVDGDRLVTFVGPPGIGKSRLAVEVATRLLGAFDGHVYLVDLTLVSDPELVVNAITRALHVDAGDPALDALTELFRDQRVLLVLDSFERRGVPRRGPSSTCSSERPGSTSW